MKKSNVLQCFYFSGICFQYVLFNLNAVHSHRRWTSICKFLQWKNYVRPIRMQIRRFLPVKNFVSPIRSSEILGIWFLQHYFIARKVQFWHNKNIYVPKRQREKCIKFYIRSYFSAKNSQNHDPFFIILSVMANNC